MMKDSKLDAKWLQDVMRANPPSIRPNGTIFSGPVRLSFANSFKPGKPSQDGNEGKFGAALLFPLGTDMKVFYDVWMREAHKAFPNNWDPQNNPVGLHLPFHDQGEKAYSATPLPGYTPSAVCLSVNSKFKPIVVDGQMNPIVDETRVYSGVWAFVGLNVYSYKNKKTGIGFGLQTVMIIADDTKLGGGGGGNPQSDFAGVQITAQSNIAAKFDAVQPATAEAPASLMPTGMGSAGNLPVHPLPATDEAAELERLMNG